MVSSRVFLSKHVEGSFFLYLIFFSKSLSFMGVGREYGYPKQTLGWGAGVMWDKHL